MADPDVSSNNTEYQKLVRAVTEIQDAVDGYSAYKDLEKQLAAAKELLRESEGGLVAGWGGGGLPRTGHLLPNGQARLHAGAMGSRDQGHVAC
jgi:hypothetical protein